MGADETPEERLEIATAARRKQVDQIVANLLDAHEYPVVYICQGETGAVTLVKAPGISNEDVRKVLEAAVAGLPDDAVPDSQIVVGPEI